MKNLLMNPWTITIIGGVVVGILVYLISQVIAAPTDRSGRKHKILIGKRGRIQSGCDIVAGDKNTAQREHGTDRRHDISLRDEGTVVAEGDVVAGDTQHTEGTQ